MRLGQDVFYFPAGTDQVFDPSKPMIARVVYVHDNNLVNLTVFDQEGHTFAVRAAEVLPAGAAPPHGECYCTEVCELTDVVDFVDTQPAELEQTPAEKPARRRAK